MADIMKDRDGICCFDSPVSSTSQFCHDCPYCTSESLRSPGCRQDNRYDDYSGIWTARPVVPAGNWLHVSETAASVPPRPEPPVLVNSSPVSSPSRKSKPDFLIKPSSPINRTSRSVQALSSSGSNTSVDESIQTAPIPAETLEIETSPIVSPNPSSSTPKPSGFPPRLRNSKRRSKSPVSIAAPTLVSPGSSRSPSAASGRSRGEKVSLQLQWAEDLFKYTCTFEQLLLQRFGSLDSAFDYIDSVTSARSGKLSMTKFVYACSNLNFKGDAKALFYFLDTRGDGVVDLDEFRTWRRFRTEYMAKLRARAKFADALIIELSS